jgi:hypothetical protein
LRRNRIQNTASATSRPTSSLPPGTSSIHPSPSIHVVPSMYLHARRSVDLSRSIYLHPSNSIPVPSSMSLHPSPCIQLRPSDSPGSSWTWACGWMIHLRESRACGNRDVNVDQDLLAEKTRTMVRNTKYNQCSFYQSHIMHTVLSNHI